MGHHEVIVVGAGLAGLCATRDLLAAGFDVLLLEARDRVGGRTWSVPFDSAGCTVDLGAEWVAPEHHGNVMYELSRYGLALERPSEAQVSSAPCPDQIQWLVKRCNDIAAEIDAGKPDWYLGHAQYDVTVSQFLDQYGISEEAVEGFLAHSFALQGASPDRYSFLNLCHEFAAFGSVEAAFTAAERRIAGGAQALSVALAADVKQVIQNHRGKPRLYHGSADGPGMGPPRGAPLSGAWVEGIGDECIHKGGKGLGFREHRGRIAPRHDQGLEKPQGRTQAPQGLHLAYGHRPV